MRIVVDINHPAHVHYFKYFIKEMQNRGHDVFVTASKKEMILRLLDNYHIDRIIISSYGNSLTTKMINIPLIDLEYFEKVRDYRPDILIGFGSIRAAHAAFLLGTTCVNFEDTENSSEQNGYTFLCNNGMHAILLLPESW
jgi:predicted glycosyltransferase